MALPRIHTPSGLSMTVVSPQRATRPPVLFLHGIFAGAWCFEHWQRRFAHAGHPTFALDLRGRDGSRPVHDIGRVRLGDYVDDAIEAARTLGGPIVVGHSMGGLLAQAVAANCTVNATVLICSAPPRGISLATPRLVLKQIRHLPAMLASAALHGSRAEHDELTLHLMHHDEADAAFARFIPDSGRVGRDISIGAVAVDSSRIAAPMLVVTATEDRFVAPRIGRQLAQKYGAELREYAGHAHFIIAEPGWERVADDVLLWLAGASR
ncbi:MAG TPA: alpha/beta fold hydrolase [Gemmatimonadales bacterium]|nr:alpha/beta fold hydrolase [Gemmatimonadales bacterium]